MSKKEKQLKAIRDNPEKPIKNMEYYENLKYPFIIERDEDGGYFIEYPDLPGCMTCGDNLEKAVELGEDAKTVLDCIMTSDSVLDLYNRLKENGIIVWIDGGWCVDALLGRQTREHDDLDIAVHRNDNAKLRRLLENCGYTEVKRGDSSEFMYVMQNGAGKILDIHVFEYDANGKNTYGIEYPYGSLTGTGSIDGQEVNCIDPQYMFRFKTDYEPKEKDLLDIRTLREKFGFELQDE